MRRWHATDPLDVLDFETQQHRLAGLSGPFLRRYRADLEAEIVDPERLSAVYDSSFAEANAVQQSEVIALMASQMVRIPNAQVNVVLPDRQATIATVANGVIVSSEDSPRRDSFCQHTVAAGREFVIKDASVHPLVCGTRWVQEEEMISYLGVPVTDRQDVVVGALCVFDDTTRDWSTADVAILTQLSLVLTRTAGL